MRIRTLTILAFCIFTTATQAEEKTENPFKTAKVGDWISYKSFTKGFPIEITTKQTVVAATEKEITIEMVSTVDKKEGKPTKMVIDLTKPYDTAANTGAAKVEVKKLDSGKETITINDKKYECTWIKNKATIKVGDKEFTSETKAWICKDVPLNGVVRTEIISDLSNTIMEMTDFGRK